MLLSLSLNAQKVKFSVNMTGETINAGGVFVTGDFQAEANMGDDWEPGMVALTQEGSTGIYSIVLTLSANTKYEYKFMNGPLSYFYEFVPLESRVSEDIDSRWICTGNLDTAFTQPIMFAGNAPANMNLLRVKVDMQKVNDISSEGIYVKGNFEGSTVVLCNLEDTSKVYEGIVYAASGNVNYKFYNGSTAENVPDECASSENRTVNLTEDIVLNQVCFSSCTTCSDNTSGIQNIETNNSIIAIYPNPCKDFAVIQFSEFISQAQINLYNIHGKNMQTDIFSGTEYTINRKNLPAGVYMVEIISSNSQKLGFQKIIFN